MTKNFYRLDNKSYSSYLENDIWSSNRNKKECFKQNVWIFQANPKNFDLKKFLEDKKEETVWKITSYKNQIKKYDIALLWLSGKESGIYAVARIMSNPHKVEYYNDIKYQKNPEKFSGQHLRVKIKIIKNLVHSPILKHTLKEIPGLENLTILRFCHRTNFRVKPEEWKIIKNLIGNV